VIEPLLSCREDIASLPPDDIEYVRDLGLIAQGWPLRIANPIYGEVIPRQLTYGTEAMIVQDASWFVRPDGGLDLSALLAEFQAFFRQHSEHWVERFDYREAGPQLLLQAFLQRIVNGGGRIEREYGLGRLRTDLYVWWPFPGGAQKAVIELKLLHKSLEATLTQGVRQTLEYADRCGTDEAHLLIFDRRPDRSWEDKLYRREECLEGRTVRVWGM